MKYNNKYTVFKPNQLLSDSDLNGNFDYLDAQNRLTRANLIGTGIVCGLDVEISGDQVTIKPGQGITSDGYFITVPDEVNLLADKPLDTAEAKSLLAPNIDTFPEVKTGSILELSSEAGQVISTEQKKERVLLLCHSVKTEDLKNICGTSDGKGSEETTDIRWLLIERSELDKLFNNNRYSEKLFGLPSTPSLPRYDVPADPDSKSIQGNFLKILRAAYDDIKGVLSSLHGVEGIKKFLPEYNDKLSLKFQEKCSFLEEGPDVASMPIFLQYYYDFFDDLLQAYEEFRQKGQGLLCQFNQTCMNDSIFPRHLMLGAFNSSAEFQLSENNRHYFRPSLLGTTDDTDACFAELRDLFNRLVKMVESFDPAKELSDLRLTPSKLGDVPLSERVIPYYYNKLDLSKVWKCDKTEEEHDEPSLLNDLEKYNFIRIEGHLGKSYQEISENEETRKNLLKYKDSYRLPFEIVALYVENSEITSLDILNKKGAAFLRRSFSSFLKRHPGIQHKAGVPLGGTFIIVYEISMLSSIETEPVKIDRGNVIADFFLPYHCCADNVPLLTFDATIGCTKTQGHADVALTNVDGVSPYFYRLDNQLFKKLEDDKIKKVHAGTHTLVVCDSEGRESAEHILHVPKPLTIGPYSYKDVSDAEYTVSFNISGGTPPYQAGDEGRIEYLNSKYKYISRKINSGDTHLNNFYITDANGCRRKPTFRNHTVCKLPCKGQSKRCAYRLWLQKPADDQDITAYNQLGEIKFIFNEENISLPNSEYLLKLSVDLLTKENFDNAVSSAVERLNNVINHALSDAGFGDNRLLMTYQPDEANDPFSILWIEYFDGEEERDEFTIQFKFSVSPYGEMTMSYSNKKDFNGAALNRTQVPAFDCSTRNQYSNDKPQKLCSGPDFTTNINVTRVNNIFTCTGDVSDIAPQSVAVWVWDFPKTQTEEPFYQGKTVTVTSDNSSDPINLTAIVDGCAAKADLTTFEAALSGGSN